MRVKLIILLLALTRVVQSDTTSAVPDLALLTRSSKTPDAVKIPSTPITTTLVLKSEPFTKPEQIDYLSLWRVRILLTVLILSITGALGIAVIHTARVFGVITDDNDIASEAKQSAIEQDTESLTHLLTQHSMRGYGSVFSNALVTTKEAPLIIQ